MKKIGALMKNVVLNSAIRSVTHCNIQKKIGLLTEDGSFRILDDALKRIFCCTLT